MERGPEVERGAGVQERAATRWAAAAVCQTPVSQFQRTKPPGAVSRGMATDTTAERAGGGDDATGTTEPAFGRALDWVLTVALVILGLLLAGGGAVLATTLDRQTVADAVREGTVRSDFLTDAELIDATLATAEYGGYGLIFAGALIAVIGVAVTIGHGRARRRGDPTPRWVLGVVGSVVSSVTSFLPFSPALGGAIAGYLDRGDRTDGAATGAIAGLIFVLPLLVFMGALTLGLFTAVPGAEGIGVVAVLVAVALVVSLVYTVGLSAVGGYVGVWLRER